MDLKYIKKNANVKLIDGRVKEETTVQVNAITNAEDNGKTQRQATEAQARTPRTPVASNAGLTQKKEDGIGIRDYESLLI